MFQPLFVAVQRVFPDSGAEARVGVLIQPLGVGKRIPAHS